MTKKPIRDAWATLEDSLIQVDVARHSLSSILDELEGTSCANTDACILFTLDAAGEQGRASFDIIHKAIKAKEARP